MAFCCKVDGHMFGFDKVAHVLKDIVNSAFNLLVHANVSTVDTIAKEYRWFEWAECRHI